MKKISARCRDLRDSSMFETCSRKKVAASLSIVLMATILQGCQGGAMRGISGQIGNPGTPAHFQLAGDGVCGKVSIDFGDGTPPAIVSNYDFSNIPQVDHLYTGWPGKKTVKAGSVENCVGSPQIIFTVGPPVLNVGYAQPRPLACDPIPNKPPLRAGTKVHMKTNPNPNVKINFGCSFNGCIYDADGKNPSTAAAPFPFLGLREYSMVMRVGTQVVQGGTDVTFTTNQAGPLEICVNDDSLSNNTGAWGLIIDVDESGAR
jgi:hypothetical protein